MNRDHIVNQAMVALDAGDAVRVYDNNGREVLAQPDDSGLWISQGDELATISKGARCIIRERFAMSEELYFIRYAGRYTGRTASAVR